MAFEDGVVNFTGKMGNMVAYRMAGTDKVVIRRKGGVSRERLKRGPEYELTRKNNSEWSGCITMASSIRRAIHPIRHLADYNFSGPLHALCKNIQLADKASDWGKRSVSLSAVPNKLEGFGLNKYNTFDSMVKSPLSFSVDKATGTAGVTIPELVPGLQLYNPRKQTLYRFVFGLGYVTDISFSEKNNRFEPVQGKTAFQSEKSAWMNWKSVFPGTSLHLSIDNWVNADNISLILSAGIEFGVPAGDNEGQYVKYSGAGKILRVV
jgi:hypothetical protein